ncbi:HNH endonuclease signature motif containing protein [Cryobacterium zhongshanensis]|uniref:HNH endonuclease n=1 Tax=Cryobacterium zhongshanensis TaxID=2928153 RepID=A0AA41QVK8_9MICO|nr:HNH endonuclease signature motif containing protein [Cryobacterium zhongshanensis]MCI4658577.1 HNH endonuclease [Cryobacterium zhongshanensis]
MIAEEPSESHLDSPVDSNVDSTAEPPPGTPPDVPPDTYLNARHLDLVEPSLADVYDAIKEADREMNRAAAKRAAAIYAAQRVLADVGRARAEAAVQAGGRRMPWSPEEATKEEFTCEVGALLRLPRRTTETLIEASRTLAEELPATREALSSGAISYRHAQVIMDQAWGITVDGDPVAAARARAVFEDVLVPDAEFLTVAKLADRARRVRERTHPETITARHQKSVEDRHLVFQALNDNMASLYVTGDAEKIQAAYHRTLDTALTLQGPDEERTLTQLAADVLTDMLIGGVTPDGTGTGVAAQVNVTVPVLTLLGKSEEPGYLAGYGPIDPDTARRLAAGAPSFTRLLTHPETGVVLSMGRDTYKVPAALKKWLEVRDETCTFPGCRRSAKRSDVDHSVEWQHGGETDAMNLAHLCPYHHAVKSYTRWTPRHLGDGRIEWTSPAGYRYIVEPSADMRPPKHPKPAPKPPAPAVDVWNLNPEPDDPEEPTPF